MQREGAAARPGVREMLPEWRTEICLFLGHHDVCSAYDSICIIGLLQQAILLQRNGFAAPAEDYPAALASARAMTVQFKTGSSDIAPHFAKQLDQLVALLKSQPQLALDLSGFLFILGSLMLVDSAQKLTHVV